MTKTRLLGLVCAGPISRTGFGRLPALAARLGPVKSSSLQSASRVVNSLGGGRAVAHYQDLSGSRTVLVHVPDGQLAEIVAELAGGLNWKNKIAILCNSTLSSSELAPLESLGAAIGSFDSVPAWVGERFVVEGSAPALREMRKLLQQGAARAIEINRGAKCQYLAGMAFSTSLLNSMIVASVKSLRGAGISLRDARGIAARLAEQTIKDYLKGGIAGGTATQGVELAALARGLELANPGLLERVLAARAAAELSPGETSPSGERPNAV